MLISPIAARRSPLPALGKASTSHGLGSIGLLSKNPAGVVTSYDMETGLTLPCIFPNTTVAK
jgi:hypothetical protein